MLTWYPPPGAAETPIRIVLPHATFFPDPSSSGHAGRLTAQQEKARGAEFPQLGADRAETAGIARMSDSNRPGLGQVDFNVVGVGADADVDKLLQLLVKAI